MASKDSLFKYSVMHLRGALDLLLCRFQKAVEYFDFSAEGYWKSFLAVFFALFSLLFSMVIFDEGKGVFTALNNAKIAFYILSLPLFALVMVYFTRWLKIDQYYSPMIIIYNWYWGLKSIVLIFVQIIMIKSLSIEAIGSILTVFSVYLNIYLLWYLLRNSLKISALLAVGVTLFAFVLNMVFFMGSLYLIAPDDMKKIKAQLEVEMQKNQNQ